MKRTPLLIPLFAAVALAGCSSNGSPKDTVDRIVENIEAVPTDTANAVAFRSADALFRAVEGAAAFDGGLVTEALIDDVALRETPSGFVYDPATNRLSFETTDGIPGFAYVCTTGAQATPC
jgi:hypothetical protein